LRNDLRASERQRGARDAEVVRLQRDLARAQASLTAKPRAPSATPRRPRGKASAT
jgi:hypothetical protein